MRVFLLYLKENQGTLNSLLVLLSFIYFSRAFFYSV